MLSTPRMMPCEPFGAIIEYDGGNLTDVATDQLLAWLQTHRVIVLRGIAAPDEDQLLENYVGQLGDILRWEFGAINELKVKLDSPNYIYTNEAVPFHWDGAFVGRVPWIIFFHCKIAPASGSGGETTFCDTTRIVEHVSADERAAWEQVSVTYRTEKLVHYGGEFTSPLVGTHPRSETQVLRYAEPVTSLNPVEQEINGTEEPQELQRRLYELLYDDKFCYEHAWEDGDIVLADNHALLHGRRAFRLASERHLRRINIM